MVDKRLLTTRQWLSVATETALTKPIDDQYAVIGVGSATGRGSRLLGVYIRSRHLQTLYNKVCEYMPGVSYENDEIALGQPFQPLFFFLDDMEKEAARQGKAPAASEEDDRKAGDLQVLLHFYDKYVKASHARIRSAIAEGSIKFEDLWAVFRPGDILYTKDEFGNPHLFRIGPSTYREGMSDFGEEADSDDEGKVLASLGAYSKILGLDAPKRFCFDSWSIEWNGSTRTFNRALKTFHINNFRGSRKITSLPFYPLWCYKADADERVQFLDHIEQRGHRWRALISGRPQSFRYEGPAMELEKGLLRSHRMDPINVRQLF